MIAEPKGALRSKLRDSEIHATGYHIQGKVYEPEPVSSGQLGIISASY